MITQQHQQKLLENFIKMLKINGFGFLDAPVSGGQAGAEKGALTVMVGGDKEDFDKAKNIIDCYSKKVQLLRTFRKWSISKNG